MTRARDRDRGWARTRVRDRACAAVRDAAAATVENETSMGGDGVRAAGAVAATAGDGAPENAARIVSYRQKVRRARKCGA